MDHIAAVQENETVMAKSTLDQQDGKKLVFSVEVNYKDKLIGKGTHERVIVNEKRFIDKITN